MSQREVAIVGRNNTKAAVTGQEELLVKINSIDPGVGVLADIASYLTAQSRSHNIKRDTLPGQIVKPYSFSIANVGTANGDVEGEILAPGEVINFDAGALNNFFGNVAYDATGTEFLITWVSA